MKILKDKFYAIIPARSGSKGVPNKNIRNFAGYPLLAWSVKTATCSNYIARTIVSTDSIEYGRIAHEYGAEVPFLRPTEISGDKSQDIDFIMHLIQWLIENENGQVPEYLIHLRPTMPIRYPAIINKGIERIKEDNTATSLCSAHEVPSLCKYFVLNSDGTFSGIMGEEYVSLPRQDCPKSYLSNGYVDILKTESILAHNNLYGTRRLAFVTEYIEDIDDEKDFLMAESSPRLQKVKSILFNT